MPNTGHISEVTPLELPVILLSKLPPYLHLPPLHFFILQKRARLGFSFYRR